MSDNECDCCLLDDYTMCQSSIEGDDSVYRNITCPYTIIEQQKKEIEQLRKDNWNLMQAEDKAVRKVADLKTSLEIHEITLKNRNELIEHLEQKELTLCRADHGYTCQNAEDLAHQQDEYDALSWAHDELIGEKLGLEARIIVLQKDLESERSYSDSVKELANENARLKEELAEERGKDTTCPTCNGKGFNVCGFVSIVCPNCNGTGSREA